MKDKVKELIEKYDSIVIHRHTRPDMDAIGSQVGLYYLIKENYPNKSLYIVGDTNDMLYNVTMDIIGDDVFKDSLSIIIDTAVSELVSDDRYKLAKEVVIIDHHRNDSNIENSLFYQKSDFTSACEILSDLAKELDWVVTSTAATYIYGGMVTDTGRFQFISNENASRVFANASFITSFYPDIKDMYNFLYTEKLEKRKVKQLFSDFEVTKHNVAYRKNTIDIIEKSGLDVFSVSRGMVNLMAGIEEIPIWVSFTEDKDNNVILAEIRSRGIIVVDIAKKYGGGGHNFACGASLKNWNEVEKMLNDLDERAKENGNIK
ncbi:DHH family phosphoesterase [Haploplasma axanthum]|uniref:Bifunctional oligoribonuclease and PAP phosphatase nrnA n=1 Tax=Haploplasma axanthum TaxID=29552 RepID=A0A449BC94_HAPAX|nr:bifunctional oligoribonuclease/PAP phosphatase NrnA [Haploplasma axanthum]VEU80057.1 Bifunctional oligoribonuclease and PAP phosphatase nrnA [Haploplasma axanthum]